MQIGMIGLGRMGSNMVRRLMRDGHQCVVFDRHADAIKSLASEGAVGTVSLEDLVARLAKPCAVWLMVQAAAVDDVLSQLVPLLDADDIVIDGGNSNYRDDIRRGAELERQGIHYLDVGTSGGVAGLERGYCLMIGGNQETVSHLDSVFSSLAPGVGAAPRSMAREGHKSTADEGYLHCGQHGAGHFVKMIHNGIEYGVMQAYAEGFNILRNANIGTRALSADAETAPTSDPTHYEYDLNLPEIAELWRRGSVITSWLLDLTAAALHNDPALERYAGRVSDSGEGRWAIMAAIDEGVPVPVLSAALYSRFSSRGQADFANKVLSAMRQGFGGHVEKPGE